MVLSSQKTEQVKKKIGNFNLKTSSFFNRDFPVHMYVSACTGLTVVVGEAQSPKVSAYLNFDIDHTCFSFTTLCEEGLLMLLPIYLDHLFFPSINKSTFAADIKHIYGKEIDKTEEMLKMYLLRLIFPSNSGYRFSPYGDNRRIKLSTLYDKVIKFHRHLYHPENCYVIVAGTSANKVIPVLDQLEKKLYKSQNLRPSLIKPWTSDIPPLALEEDLETIVFFPCGECPDGHIQLAWRGPSISNYTEIIAPSLLLRYLTKPNGILEKEFVKCPQPQASKINLKIELLKEVIYIIEFSGVPINKISSLKNNVIQFLETTIEQDSQLFSKERMANVFIDAKVDVFKELEDNIFTSFAKAVINYQIYCHRDKQFQERMNYLYEVEYLEQKPQEFWMNMLKNSFLSNNCISVKAIPSENKKDEFKEIIGDSSKLNFDSLESLTSFYKCLRMYKNKFILKDVLKILPNPICMHFQSHTVVSHNDQNARESKFRFGIVPWNIHVIDSYSSYFVNIFTLIDTTKLNPQFQFHTTLFIESLVKSSFHQNDSVMSMELVSINREDDLVYLTQGIGIKPATKFTCSLPSNIICIRMKVAIPNYVKAIRELKDILFNANFTEEDVTKINDSLLDEALEFKQDGNAMVFQVMKGIIYNNANNHFNINVCLQEDFLKRNKQNLEECSQDVLNELNIMKEQLINPKNVRIFMAVNLDVLSAWYPNPACFWADFFPKERTCKPLNIACEHEYILENPHNSCIVGACDACYFCLCSPCVIDSDDLAPLMVCMDYITRFEGKLFKEIRAKNLAYFCSVLIRPYQRKLYYTIYKAYNLIEAFTYSKEIFGECATDEATWDIEILNEVKNSSIMKLFKSASNIDEALQDLIIDFYCNNKQETNINILIEKIHNVTIDDLKSIAKKIIPQMFDFNVSRIAVVCSQEELDEIHKNFEKLGIEINKFPSFQECFGFLF
ncbi:uncharacterized protein YOL098C-like isoform X2 [Cimex lectularius]|uniref:Peptidase M16 C-terminal domain-containing protein n=1 Tax=Cimex lectularius TaxID=79782 RepID=A0A8I6TDE2_CIMLE|nr:uncharacterized protein YOL098C-like isoform X2 [Cimex lectularius]